MKHYVNEKQDTAVAQCNVTVKKQNSDRFHLLIHPTVQAIAWRFDVTSLKK